FTDIPDAVSANWPQQAQSINAQARCHVDREMKIVMRVKPLLHTEQNTNQRNAQRNRQNKCLFQVNPKLDSEQPAEIVRQEEKHAASQRNRRPQRIPDDAVAPD